MNGPGAAPRGPLAVGRRLLAGLALGMLGPLPLWPLPVAHLVLPVVAALHLRRTGPGPYLREDAPRVAAGLGWLVALQAWAALGAERLPLREQAAPVPTGPASGEPSPASALLRLVTGAPEALLVVAAGLAALLPWAASAALLAAGRTAPAALGRLPAAAVRRHAAYLARQASLPAQALSR